MAMAENWLNFSEILRITSNDDYEPEIYMQGRAHGMRYLSVTPNGITFDYVSTSTGKRTSLTIDPTVIGAGMTNAVIKKTSDGMLYVAENEETKYKLTINISGNGTTSPSPGDKYVTSGSTIRIIAYPDEGYEFDRWSDGGSQSHNIVVSYDGYSVTAYFTKKEDAKYTCLFHPVHPMPVLQAEGVLIRQELKPTLQLLLIQAIGLCVGRTAVHNHTT